MAYYYQWLFTKYTWDMYISSIVGKRVNEALWNRTWCTCNYKIIKFEFAFLPHTKSGWAFLFHTYLPGPHSVLCFTQNRWWELISWYICNYVYMKCELYIGQSAWVDQSEKVAGFKLQVQRHVESGSMTFGVRFAKRVPTTLYVWS